MFGHALDLGHNGNAPGTPCDAPWSMMRCDVISVFAKQHDRDALYCTYPNG